MVKNNRKINKYNNEHGLRKISNNIFTKTLEQS